MNQLKLSKIQREILVGILLGDAHLEVQGSKISNAGLSEKDRRYVDDRPGRIKVEQSDKHKAYIQHLFDSFANFLTPGATLRKREVIRPSSMKLTRERSVNWCFQTRTHASFIFYAKQFYLNKKKRVPPIISKLLTPRALAYWFMDDGSMKSKQSKGVLLNTQGFTYKEVCCLCDVLTSKIQLQCWPRKQKEGYQIYVSGHSYERLRELIGPFLIPEMMYKFPLPRKRGLRLTQLPKE
jgi:LAGLIDADG DNA endonuclease family